MNGTITIANTKTTPLSLDIKLSEDRVIRDKLEGAGDVDGRDSIEVGDITTLDELNRNPQARAYLDNLDANGLADPLITITPAAGDGDLPGSDSATSTGNSEGIGGLEILNLRSTDADGADHTVVAALPFTAVILDIQLMVDTAEAATTWTLRDDTGGGGNALSQALSVAATGRVQDDGSGTAGALPTVPKGSPIVINKSAAASATGNAILLVQRT